MCIDKPAHHAYRLQNLNVFKSSKRTIGHVTEIPVSNTTCYTLSQHHVERTAKMKLEEQQKQCLDMHQFGAWVTR